MPHIAACTVAAMSTSNDKVPMTSKVEMVSVSTLEPYANNTRVHTAGQVEKIAKSIRQFGFITPVILSKEGEIVAGHGRLLAAKKLGILKVPCIRAGHLTRSQWRAYSIADNRLTELGGWDTSSRNLNRQWKRFPQKAGSRRNRSLTLWELPLRQLRIPSRLRVIPQGRKDSR